MPLDLDKINFDFIRYRQVGFSFVEKYTNLLTPEVLFFGDFRKSGGLSSVVAPFQSVVESRYNSEKPETIYFALYKALEDAIRARRATLNQFIGQVTFKASDGNITYQSIHESLHDFTVGALEREAQREAMRLIGKGSKMEEQVGYRLERENGIYRLCAVTLGNIVEPYKEIGLPLTDIPNALQEAVDTNTTYHQQKTGHVRVPLNVNAPIRQLYDFALEALLRENIGLSLGLIKRVFVVPIGKLSGL